MRYFIILLITFLLSGCSAASPYNSANQNTDIVLSIEEIDITIATEAITLIYTNKTDKDYTGGASGLVEFRKGNKWVPLPLNKDVAWVAAALIIGPFSIKKITYPIKVFYDIQEKGYYRIIAPILLVLDAKSDESFVICEFTVS